MKAKIIAGIFAVLVVQVLALLAWVFLGQDAFMSTEINVATAVGFFVSYTGKPKGKQTEVNTVHSILYKDGEFQIKANIIACIIAILISQFIALFIWSLFGLRFFIDMVYSSIIGFIVGHLFGYKGQPESKQAEPTM